MHWALKQMLNEPIKVQQLLGKDGAGDPTYGEPKDLLCYVDGTVRMVRDVYGKEVVSEETLYLDETASWLKHEDQITMSDQRTPAIISIKKCRDEFGALDHLEVYV
jgi:hypothetical protein